MVNIQDEINKLVELSYYLYEKEIQRICDEKITDDDYIQKILTYLLDYSFDDGMLFLFRTLLRYYYNVNEEAANSFVDLYNSRFGDKERYYYSNDKNVS